MPTYLQACQNSECNHEWEELYGMNDPIPPCPLCNQEGAKRLINCTNKGTVELTGQDLTAHIKSEAKKLQNEASKSEKLYSNLLGESKYDSMVKSYDKAKKR